MTASRFVSTAAIAVALLASGVAHSTQVITINGKVMLPCGWPQAVYVSQINQDTGPNELCAWQNKFSTQTPTAYPFTLHPNKPADLDLYIYDKDGNLLLQRYAPEGAAMVYCGDFTGTMPAKAKRIVIALNPGCGNPMDPMSLEASNTSVSFKYSYTV